MANNYHKREPWTSKAHPILMPAVLALSFGGLAFICGMFANLSRYYSDDAIAAMAVSIFSLSGIACMWFLWEASVALGEALHKRTVRHKERTARPSYRS
jgi:hypothetical protein